MRYSLISDVHIDFNKEFPFELEDNVIIAGDIANGFGGVKFVRKLREKGHTVFAIDGNHEHYTPEPQRLRARENVFRDVYNEYQELWGDVQIVGVCGWYRIFDSHHWGGYMRDAKYVSADEVNEAAARQATYLDATLLRAERPTIVVTHTAPCEETLDPRYEGSAGNAYFWNPLLRPLLAKHKDKIIYWHHGHTHAGTDQIVDGVRIITNPWGYPGENPTWTPLSLTA